MAWGFDFWRRVVFCAAGCGLLIVGCVEFGLFSWDDLIADLVDIPWVAVLVIGRPDRPRMPSMPTGSNCESQRKDSLPTGSAPPSSSLAQWVPQGST